MFGRWCGALRGVCVWTRYGFLSWRCERGWAREGGWRGREGAWSGTVLGVGMTWDGRERNDLGVFWGPCVEHAGYAGKF